MTHLCLRAFAPVALLLTSSISVAQQRSFTIEQVLSAPFADELVAAPNEGRLAWVFDAQGARNIWVAAPPDYRGRQVTTYREDDGQEVAGLAWTPDGRSIVYVRGGDPNGAGEHPNPAQIAAGVDQGIWVISADGGQPRRLAEGRGPAIGPRGNRLAFIKGGQVWMTGLSERDTATQLLHTRGGASALRWSPDGSKLAFVSGRERHSFVGVYDLASRTLRYLDPSVDRDGNPVWSPDGRQVAFTRIPASTKDIIFVPERRGEPWSIRVADATTGEGREIWRAKPGDGSVYREIVADDQLIWAAGDRIVFPWERDGWTHLYSVPARGGDATLLTPGAFEVETVSRGAGSAEVLYSSNQNDIDRRHLWRVRVAGDSAPSALTRGDGIEWGAVLASDGKTIVMLHSDARRPARPALLERTGSLRDLVSDRIPAEFPTNALVEPEQVIFKAADGLAIHGQLFLPPALKPGERRPALIFLHGGSRRQMVLGFHYNLYYSNAYAFNQYLANQGYVVLAVNFRSGIGYGMKFREALDYGAAGASEFRDVLAAGRYLRRRADVDPARVGLWGGSYGGYLTALGLARASDVFAAGVDIHGVHNWNPVIKNFVPAYDSVRYAREARLAYESSPLFWVKGWRSPVLFIHADDDRNVPFTETIYMVEALRKRGVVLEQLVFPDDVHSFLLHRNWVRAYRASAAFFDRRLRRGSANTAEAKQ